MTWESVILEKRERRKGYLLITSLLTLSEMSVYGGGVGVFLPLISSSSIIKLVYFTNSFFILKHDSNT